MRKTLNPGLGAYLSVSFSFLGFLYCLSTPEHQTLATISVFELDLALKNALKLGGGRKTLEVQEGTVDLGLWSHFRPIGGNKLLLGLPLHLDLFLCVSFGHYWYDM